MSDRNYENQPTVDPRFADVYRVKQSADATGEPYAEKERSARVYAADMAKQVGMGAALCQEADNSCAVGTPRQRMLNKQLVIANLQRQLQIKSDEVSRLHRAVTILTAHPEFDMFLELNHLLEGIKL